MTADHERALARLWEEQFTPLTRVAHKSLRDWHAAEDVTMQSFAKLGRRMEQQAVPEDELLYLLRRIQSDNVVDELRRADHRPVPTTDAQLCQEIGVRDDFLPQSMASLHRDFDAAVRGLHEHHRDAFILVQLRGLELREAAVELGVSHMTVSRWNQSAHDTVREEITP